MNSITTLKTEIAAFLQRGLADARVLAAYSSAQREFPLKRPAVAVGLDSVELSPAGLGGYWGDSAAGGGIARESMYGPGALITLRFDLYAPLEDGADTLHALYEQLCGALMLRGNPYGVLRITAGEIAFDKAAAANRLIAKAMLRSAILLRDQEAEIERIALIRNTH